MQKKSHRRLGVVNIKREQDHAGLMPSNAQKANNDRWPYLRNILCTGGALLLDDERLRFGHGGAAGQGHTVVGGRLWCDASFKDVLISSMLRIGIGDV